MENKSTKKAPGPIRTGGIAALFVTAGTLGALGYFLAEPFAKSIITSSMEKAFGAETNIESVDLNWQPFGIAINQLQQADPDQLSQNLFEFNTASASVNLWELLLGNVLVDELTVDKLAFNTKRAQMGEAIVSDSPENQQEGDKSSVSGGLEVPSAKQLLAKADLITEKKAKQLKAVWGEENEALKTKLAALPSKDSLKSYEARWKEIENTKIKSLEDLEALKQKVDQLKADIKKDKSAIDELKSQYKLSKNNVDQAYSELKAAPDQDWDKIKSTLPIDDPSAVAISKLIFGDEVTGYIVKAEELYQIIKPIIDANKEVKAQDKLKANENETGVFVEFKLDQQWPSWMIKQLLLNVIAPNQQTYKVTGEEITSENYVRNTASRYAVDLVSERQGESFTLNGQYFINKKADITTEGDWVAKGIVINDKSLSDSDDLSIVMSNAELKGNGQFKWQEQLSSIHTIKFDDVVLSGDANTNLAKLTLDTLSKVSAFNLNVGVDGNISAPDVSIKSDLDNQINAAFKQQVSDRWVSVKAETKEKLNERVQTELNLNNDDLQKFNEIKAQYENAESNLKKFGQEQLDKFIDEKKSQYEDSVKDKLKDKLKGKLKDFGF